MENEKMPIKIFLRIRNWDILYIYAYFLKETVICVTYHHSLSFCVSVPIATKMAAVVGGFFFCCCCFCTVF